MATSHAGRHPDISTATTSPHTPEAKGGRITVIGIGSPAVAEGHTLLRGREISRRNNPKIKHPLHLKGR